MAKRITPALQVYTITLLLLVYVLNQADRQLVPTLISGGLRCNDTSVPQNKTSNSTVDCIHFSDVEEGLLKGPAFTVVYGVFGISLSYFADNYNRIVVLAIALAFWSLATSLSYFVQEFYQLALLRMLLGIGEAVCNPVAYSLIADIFSKERRALVLSMYHLGVYVGGGVGYIAATANASVGWRLTFMSFGAPGIVLAMVCLFTLKDPGRGANEKKDDDILAEKKTYNIISVFRHMKGSPPFYILIVASCLRQIAGLSLGAYTPTFFKNTYHLNEHGYYVTMSMIGVIVFVCGSIGQLIGGSLGDKLMSRSPGAKALVIFLSQLVAAPFITGVLLSPNRDTALGVLCIAYITAETWLGPAAAIVQDVTAPSMRAQASAVYMTLNTLVGGCGPLVVSAMIEENFSFKGINDVQSALLLFVPVFYVLSGIAFGFVGIALRNSSNQRAITLNTTSDEAAPLLADQKQE